MLVDIAKVKEFVVEPGLEINLRPLLLFKGGLTPGQAKSRFNFVRSMMSAEIPNMTEVHRLSKVENDVAHFCGFHAKYGWERLGMQGFFSRLLQSPAVIDRIPGLEDYLYWVVEQTPQAFLVPLTPISATAFRTLRDWRRVARPRIERQSITEIYPFISGTPNEDHNLLLAVDALVPKGLRNDTRADVCQDMIVAILTGDATLDNIKDAPTQYVRKFMNASAEKYGHLSLDMPMYRGENAGMKTLGESIV